MMAAVLLMEMNNMQPKFVHINFKDEDVESTYYLANGARMHTNEDGEVRFYRKDGQEIPFDERIVKVIFNKNMDAVVIVPRSYRVN